MTDKAQLLEIVGLFERLKIKYWVDGGWGIDLLLGKQTREHRDIDIDFDAACTELLLTALQEEGYSIITDWRPTRIELQHPTRGMS